jgi:hypothetical protein
VLKALRKGHMLQVPLLSSGRQYLVVKENVSINKCDIKGDDMTLTAHKPLTPIIKTRPVGEVGYRCCKVVAATTCGDDGKWSLARA